MNQFDDKIRKMAKQEYFAVPEGFSHRVAQFTENLIRTNPRKRKSMPIRVLIAASVLLLMTTIVVAAPRVLSMAEGVMAYFNAPEAFRHLSNQATYEKYNAEVGVSTEDKGITITLDNIAVDDNYINVFYTLNSKTPIKLLGDKETPLPWRMEQSAVNFWFKANGRYIEPAGQDEKNAYMLDQYTMKGMQRFTLLDKLDDQFELEVYTNNILRIKGQWHIAVNVDKSSVAVESKTVMPNIKATVNTRLGDDTSEYKVTEHKITVKKVSISPFGSQVVLAERGYPIFEDFAIRDDKGNYLTVIPKAIGASDISEVENSFEFIAKSKEVESISIIPITMGGYSKLENMPLGIFPLKLPVNNLGAYILKDIQIDDEKMVAVVYQNGAVPIRDFELLPSDENGKLLQFAEYSDTVYNRETGAITITNYWSKDVTPENLKKIKGLSYYTNYDFELNEEEKITIELN